MITVPFNDLLELNQSIQEELGVAFNRVLKSGTYILGDELKNFEKEYAEFCDAKYAVGVGNGLDALKIGLIALGIKPGDEVIVPSHTFIATWLAVTECKAIPVPVEPDLDSFTISAESIRKAITSKTKVIIPVHLYGHPANLDPIISLAAEFGLKVLEDAAQAHGARYKGQRIGSHGDLVAWSFYPGKNLGALGDGGAITTNDEHIANSVRQIRNYGSTKKYEHEIVGVNSRLDSLQAAFLRVKIQYIDAWNKKRANIAKIYIESLSECSKYGLNLPKYHHWADPVWHLFVIQYEMRDELNRNLINLGINTLIHYPKPPHLQKVFVGLGYGQGSFPIAEKISHEVLSLPIYPTMTIELNIHTAKMVKKILINNSV